MRGEQRGYGLEPIQPESLTYLYVLVLVSAYLALVLVSVFVLDWFTLRGWGRSSVDLWAASGCDLGIGCVSTPLEKAGHVGFRPYAVAALWATCASGAVVLARAGTFLVGVRVPRQLGLLAYVLLGISATSVIAIVATGLRHDAMPALRYDMTLAPFVLLGAHVVALFAMFAVSSAAWRRRGRASGIPAARVVSP